jgi:type IV secretory pathway VirJ component
MVKTKKRSSAAIPKSAIEQVSSTLKDLPEKPKENVSLREAISELHGSITTALARGYSYDEVVEILAGQGVEITVASLKRYLAATRKEVSEKPIRTKRGTRSRNAQLAKQAEVFSDAATSANGTLNGAATMTSPVDIQSADSTEQAPATKKRQTRTGSRATTTSKTKTAAKAKPTSRLTSSRSRRKSSGASN